MLAAYVVVEAEFRCATDDDHCSAPIFPLVGDAMPEAKVRKKSTRPMSDEHKAALAAGRVSGRAVRGYLEALETSKPKRGRKRTAESVQRRLDAIDASIPEADPLTRLSLFQERIDLAAELESMGAGGPDLAALEAGFVAHAADYSKRKGISYGAWRELGVPAATLKAAGISR
jgi:hypothetical protein